MGARLGALVLAAACGGERPPAPTEGSTGCSHPYVPTTPGSELEYEWRSATGATSRVTMRLEHARDQGRRSTWSIVTEVAGTANEVGLELGCDEGGAEEPWIGLGLPAGVAIRSHGWRVPRDLGVGDRFGGTLELELALLGRPLAIERSHEVVETETVEAGGASYDALRVSIAETTEHGSAPIRSTAWIAPDVGLVRLVQLPGSEHEASYELRSWRRGR